MATIERCEKTDLPIEQCGDTCCRPDLAEAMLPVAYEGTWIEARYPSTCACGCNRRVDEGDGIVLADLDDEDGWCLLEHTRSADGGH